MVRTKTANVICVMTYSSIDPSDGNPVVFREGARLKAGSPVVRKHPQFWASQDDLTEIQKKWRAAWSPSVPPNLGHHLYPPSEPVSVEG